MIILIFRTITLSFFPFPSGLEWMNTDDMNQYLRSLPDNAFILILSSHVVGAFLGSLIAALITKKGRFSAGIISGSIIFVAVTLFNFRFDFPTLFVVSSTLLAALAAFAGSAVGKSRTVS